MCPPDLLVRTPALRPGGPGPSRTTTTTGTCRTLIRRAHRMLPRRVPYTSNDYAACGGWQDDRHDLRRTKDDIQDDGDARRLPTVHFLQCPTTAPRDLRENDDFRAPTHVRRPSL